MKRIWGEKCSFIPNPISFSQIAINVVAIIVTINVISIMTITTNHHHRPYPYTSTINIIPNTTMSTVVIANIMKPSSSATSTSPSLIHVSLQSPSPTFTVSPHHYFCSNTIVINMFQPPPPLSSSHHH